MKPDPTAPHRVYVEGTKVELLGVGPLDEADLVDVPDDDALFVAAHAWALQTATSLTVVATTDDDDMATAPFATPGGLFAMKLHAIQTRSAIGADKRSGDAWDLYRLLLDRSVPVGKNRRSPHLLHFPYAPQVPVPVRQPRG